MSGPRGAFGATLAAPSPLAHSTDTLREGPRERDKTMAADDDENSKQAIYNVDVDISVVLGQSNLRVNQLLKLGRGAVVELEQKTSDPVEIFANDVLIARGEVVITAGDKIGVTLTELVKSIYSKV